MKKIRNKHFVFIGMLLLIMLCFISPGATQNSLCDTPYSTLTGNSQYKVNWQFYWLPTNPQTIGQNEQVEVEVYGGYPPFIWTVSGNGFSLAFEETNERTNSLIASFDACGAASVTVIDSNGYQTIGSLRCLSGKWSDSKSGCIFGGVDEYVYDGGATYIPGNWPSWIFTTGKYQQYQSIGRTWAGDCSQSCTICTGHCSEKAAQSIRYQCYPCLNNTSIVPCRYLQNEGRCCTTYVVTYKEWICE
jgi:hypothetical protein